jgi:Na+-driven multidrug efflux pump
MDEARRSKLLQNKYMLFLTIPIFIELLLQLVVGYSDQIMMSQYENAVNGIANANTVINVILNVFIVLSSASIILITQYRGAKDKNKEEQVYYSSFWFNFITSFIITAIVVGLSRFYLVWIQTPESALNDAILYSMIAGGSIIFQVMATTLSSYLKANNFMKESMITNIIMNVINIVGNIVLINVFAQIDMPIVGVALSSSISRIIGFIILLIIYIKKVGVSLSFKKFIQNRRMIKMILRVGAPSGGEALSYQTSQIIIQMVVNQIVIYNMNNVGIGNIKTYATMFALVTYLFTSAVSQSMQVIVGELLGAGETKAVDIVVKKTRNISIIASTSIALIFFLLSDYMFRIFHVTDPELLKIAKGVMGIEIALEFGRAFNIVYVRALQTSGDVVFPTVSAIIFCWSVAVVGSFVFGSPYILNMGLLGVWMAMALDECIRAAIFVVRWHNGRWKSFNLSKI